MQNAQAQVKIQAQTAQDTQTWRKRRKKATERSESGSRKQSECKRRTCEESSKELKKMFTIQYMQTWHVVCTLFWVSRPAPSKTSLGEAHEIPTVRLYLG
jgi:hypothetical protein